MGKLSGISYTRMRTNDEIRRDIIRFIEEWNNNKEFKSPRTAVIDADCLLKTIHFLDFRLFTDLCGFLR